MVNIIPGHEYVINRFMYMTHIQVVSMYDEFYLASITLSNW